MRQVQEREGGGRARRGAGRGGETTGPPHPLRGLRRPTRPVVRDACGRGGAVARGAGHHRAHRSARSNHRCPEGRRALVLMVSRHGDAVPHRHGPRRPRGHVGRGEAMRLLPWWTVVVATVGALIGSEVVRSDTRRELDACTRSRLALEDEVQRMWRIHFAEPPTMRGATTVYPDQYECARDNLGRWVCS